jgi:hypothetical protein
MRKNVLLNFLGYFRVREYILLKTPEKKRSVSQLIALALFFLVTNISFAQQPACNLNGILEAKRLRDGGQNFTINSEVLRTVPGTIYRWEFKTNTSAATFATPNGQPSMLINPGNKNGNFHIKLTVINPPDSRGASKTCSCTKSVSIGNL